MKELFSKIFTGRIMKYVLLISIVIFEVPLHEGMHAGLAKALPGVSCDGVAINAKYWYAVPLQIVTLGFYESDASLDPNTGGYAKITSAGSGFVEKISGAVTAIGPELITLLLAIYLIVFSVKNINIAGKRLYSVVCFYAAMPLLSNVYYYLRTSSLSPEKGSDYFNFTQSVLKTVYLPGQLAYVFTFLSAGVMVWLALVIANKLSEKK